MKALLPLLFVLIFNSIIIVGADNDYEKWSFEELDHRMDTYFGQGNFKACIPITKAAINKARLELESHDPKFIEYVHVLAYLYMVCGEYSKSESEHFKALSMFDYAEPIDTSLYLSTQNNLSVLYINMGRYQDAEQICQKTMQERLKIFGKSSKYAMSLNNLSTIYKLLGMHQETESLLLEAIKIQKEIMGIHDPNLLLFMHNLAVLYDDMEAYDKAEALFEKIKNSKLPKKHPNYVIYMDNFASLYVDMKQLDKAKLLYLGNIKLKEKILGKNHPDYARSLHLLGDLYEKTNELERAVFYLSQAQKAREAILGKFNLDYATTTLDLAIIQHKNGNYKQSLRHINQCLTSLTRQNIEVNQSSTYKELENIPYSSSRHVLQLCRALNALHELYVVNYFNLPKAQCQKHQKQISLLAIKLLEQCRKEFISDNDKLRILDQSHEWMLRNLKLLNLNTDINLALKTIESHKSVLLLDAIKASQAYQLANLPDSLAERERGLYQRKKSIDAALLQAGNSQDSLRTELNDLTLAIIQFKQLIEREFPNYSTLKYSEEAITIEGIQQKLGPEQGVLEYVVGDSTCYVLFVGPTDSFVKKLPISAVELNERVQNLRRVLNDYDFAFEHKKQSNQIFVQHAYWCYQNLVAPILTEKKSLKQLFIVPDGVLCHLPFEVFLTKKVLDQNMEYQNLDYLFKTHQISYNYSIALWQTNLKKSSAGKSSNGKVLAMAARYNQTNALSANLRTPANIRLRSTLSNLPAAGEEVNLIAEQFEGFYGVDSLASEQKFKEIAAQYGIIHLAMHGLLNERFPTLSSIAFSENGDSLENNFLQAYEIAQMQLNADLVVLSACESGYGKFENGNGTASLARAFMYAGTPALVVSLWKVEDNATAKIMGYFYNELSHGKNKAEALRQAKISFLQQSNGITSHPAYWAPFIQIGNSEPIQIQRKSDDRFVIWCLAIGFLLLAVLIIFKKRKAII